MMITYHGRPASKGLAEGKLVAWDSVSEGCNLAAPFILYAHMTTPEMVPWMRKASAVVTEVGGVTCHAAVVAREFGLPCVVAVGTGLYGYNGRSVVVNGTTGEVMVK